jgi:predicted SnoaL-like aldol condensation-catalyzing enzyme
MARDELERRNHALVMGLFEQVLNPLDSGAVDRFIAPDYIQHSQLAQAPGRDGLKAFLDFARKASPHAVHDVKRSFVEGDHVIVHYHVRRWPGDPGLAVVDIFRIADGLIAEHWDVVNEIEGGADDPAAIF